MAEFGDLNRKRILVTGGRGFIGSATCLRLEASGAEVYSVGRTRNSEDANARSLVCDLENYESTRALLVQVRPHQVLHMASHVLGARSPDVVLSTFRSNLMSTINLLMAAREAVCERIILTGSIEEPEPDGEWSVPNSPYTASKLAAGMYGRMFHAMFDLPVVILRVAMVYGPNQSDLSKLVPYVISSLDHGEQPRLTSGVRLADWIHVDDVAEAFLKATCAEGIEGATIDVGSGELVSVKMIVEAIYRIMQVPVLPQFGSIPDRPFEQAQCADTLATWHQLNWRPRIELLDGLAATVDWYRARQDGNPAPGD